MSAEPPPAYSAPPPAECTPPRLELLPRRILLQVLSHLSLPDLVCSVRPTCRRLYLPSMALARMQALPLWMDEVRSAARVGGGAPPSTDPLSRNRQLDSLAGHCTSPYDTSSPPGTADGLLSSRTRECAVLDLFVVALSHSVLRLGASSLLFTSEDDALRLLPSEKRTDLWGLLQPRARVEDLLAARLRADHQWKGDPRLGAGARCVRGEDVRVELKARVARVLLPFRSAAGRTETWRGVVSAARSPGESLEVLAERLAGELQRAAVLRRTDGVSRWYESPG